MPPAIAFPSDTSAIPVITLSPSNRAYTGIVDRLRRARPIGATVLESQAGPMLTVIGERAGFVIANDRAMAKVWKRNIKNSDGAHVLIVTDPVVNTEILIRTVLALAMSVISTDSSSAYCGEG